MCCVGAKVMRPVGSNQAWHSPTYSYSNSTASTFTRCHTWTQECRGRKTTMWREKGRTRSRRIMQRHGSCSFARKNQIKNNALKRQLQTSGDVTQLQLMWLCLIQITQMYESSSICRSDGGEPYEITKTYWKHSPLNCRSLGNAPFPSPTVFPTPTLLPNPQRANIVLLCFRKDLPIGIDGLEIMFHVPSSTSLPFMLHIYGFHMRKRSIRLQLRCRLQ